MDKLKFNTYNLGQIDNASMELAKINVICGDNKAGKSDLSRLLYCFLAVNSNQRIKFIYHELYPFIKRFESFLEVIKDSYPYAMPLIYKIQSFSTEYNSFQELNAALNSIIDICGGMEIPNQFNKEFSSHLGMIERLAHAISDEDYVYGSVFKKLLKSEFLSIQNEGKSSFSGKYNNQFFNFSIDFSDLTFSRENRFYVDNVFYLNSLSNLDFINKLNRNNHTNEIMMDLNKERFESDDLFDEILNEGLIDLEFNSYDLLEGRFEFIKGDLVFINNNGEVISVFDIDYGFKQIGIIQLLLSNRLLNEDSFLIIDNPENDLSVEWQVKYAELLVLIAKELDVTLYINSQSPIFIQAINKLSAKYDLVDETNFYMAYKAENGYEYNFVLADERDELYNFLLDPLKFI